MRMKPTLTYSDATAVMAGCMRAAQQRGIAVSVAIADEAGNLLHFGRMDGARSHTVDLANQKARLAASIGVATSVIAEMHRQQPSAAAAGFPGGGGAPVIVNQQCAGGVGVSGATPEIDDAIARAGIAELEAGAEA